ncbi:hypothetical protein NDU88_006747 [Pleurodeles waltl]|uniref:Uncharacterized protein n=1 Tax=Pleurodeles waltl TaxID=8319 RepID=A0AAV7QKW4_PLEWA|nr:hypothetical protein NDU88_006747 [Pleurodeles waltl]
MYLVGLCSPTPSSWLTCSYHHWPPRLGLAQSPCEIGRHRAEAAWKMVAGRRVPQGTGAEEGCRSMEEESVARLREAGDSGKE